jgi:hypothetical protein
MIIYIYILMLKKNFEKYLKYKNKYLKLKEQFGGIKIIENKCIKFKENENKYFDYFDKHMIEKKVIEETLFIKIKNENIKIIGSGGNGIILLASVLIEDVQENFVIKLIYQKSKCEGAVKEYNNINKLNSAFSNFLKLNLSDDLNRLVKYINPLQSFGYYDCNIEFAESNYRCCVITSYNIGYNIRDYIIPNLDKTHDDNFKEKLVQLYESVLILPVCDRSMFNDINISLQDPTAEFNIKNPIRYGILNIFNLYKLIGNNDYLIDYGKIMGIIQGIILWGAELSTDDFEILLGPKDNSYVFNLIDYGELKDLSKDINDFIISQSDVNLENLSSKITDLTSLFFAKQSFPGADEEEIFQEFLKYFKITGKLLTKLDDDNLNKLNEKIKEKLK